ncbi:MAG: hypothetical protein ACQEV7_07735 [Bacillota bacterium]
MRYIKAETIRRKGGRCTIAFINGQWNTTEQRRTKLDKLRKYIAPRVRNLAALTTDEKVELKRYIDEHKRLDAINRGEGDLLFFAYYYFGEDLNPDNSGNWIPKFSAAEPFNLAPDFHHEICDIMNVVSTEEVNKRVAVAAPRSHAKSSFLSKAFPIHALVYRKRKYIILISETPSVSTANLEWIKTQLQNNEKLRRDFGPIFHPKQQMNPRDNSSEFIAWEDLGEGKQRQLTLVQAASSGQALRGRNWNGNRPDLIVCDDLEDKRNTNTEQLRQELKDWFSQVVIPLGDPEGKRTAIVFMGTTVHHDSLLINVMKNRSDFESKRFQAIIEPPTRADLWEQCRLIYTNREHKDSAKQAELFYVANRAEMDAGAVVLWPSVQPLFKLMAWKWDNGSKAFNTEYMNNPVDEESQVFNIEKFTYWTDKRDSIPYDSGEYSVSMGVDLAMGKERGDYSAIAVVARHKESNVTYVIDSYGERIKPEKFFGEIVARVLKYQPDVIAVESNMAQEFFADELKKKLINAGYPASSRLHKVKHRSRKDLRIEALGPDIETGLLQFSRRHSLLLEQFELYGTGVNDDLPDALEQSVSAVKSGSVTVRNLKQRTR